MKKIKQIAAIIICVMLVGMYVVSFIAAIMAKPQAHGLFMASVGMTIMVPLLLYGYTIIYKVIHPEKSEYNEEDNESKDESEDNHTKEDE